MGSSVGPAALGCGAPTVLTPRTGPALLAAAGPPAVVATPGCPSRWRGCPLTVQLELVCLGSPVQLPLRRGLPGLVIWDPRRRMRSLPGRVEWTASWPCPAVKDPRCPITSRHNSQVLGPHSTCFSHPLSVPADPQPGRCSPPPSPPPGAPLHTWPVGPPSISADLSSPAHTSLHQHELLRGRHHLLTDLCPPGPSGSSGLVPTCVDKGWTSGPWVRSAAQTSREGEVTEAGSAGLGGGG